MSVRFLEIFPARGILSLCLLLMGLLEMGGAAAVERFRGQRLFLPVYSEVPYGNRNAVLDLAVTMTLRNLDEEQSITLKRVDYIGVKGGIVRSFLSDGVPLKPMAAEIYVIRESDRTAGRSAGFLVEWESSAPAIPPIVEGVMVNGAYNQGMAFVTTARVLSEKP